MESRRLNTLQLMMHKVGPKRQITLPKDLCAKSGIQPGDRVEIFEYEGRITVIKKERGASLGLLKHLKGDTSVTNEGSLAWISPMLCSFINRALLLIRLGWH
ncbi:transcriptional regulator, AbrB family [Nitrosococcus halophilus Nc 4]|uniref:Transcriptional regulator, AbrB family n=1 Tax=Nitrosococcus halophilus (strain Nc4) TaxID=472759 RepID=D5C0U0_NITHN|nr:AbrB/MazE/SpoVT family DNA-binding domain-containing protein [Nitrosococcus halophilus]ADE16413.1 transcriptional regulator, AbrB family [Nitrosococcus halophilus Nc 4]